MPTAILDASAITAIRTAAVTAVATGLLARDDARTLAILGAGVQARSHLRALANVRGFERVRVYAPTAAHARAVVEEADLPSGELSVATSAEEAVRGADVVVAVTNSREPVLQRAWLTPGAHVNAVGASTLRTRELTARRWPRAPCSATAASRSATRPASSRARSPRARSPARSTSAPSSVRYWRE